MVAELRSRGRGRAPVGPLAPRRRDRLGNEGGDEGGDGRLEQRRGGVDRAQLTPAFGRLCCPWRLVPSSTPDMGSTHARERARGRRHAAQPAALHRLRRSLRRERRRSVPPPPSSSILLLGRCVAMANSVRRVYMPSNDRHASSSSSGSNTTRGSPPRGFKSADGHAGKWALSLRRLNLHLVALRQRRQGCGVGGGEVRGVILVDRRRGRLMPDASPRPCPSGAPASAVQWRWRGAATRRQRRKRVLLVLVLVLVLVLTERHLLPPCVGDDEDTIEERLGSFVADLRRSLFGSNPTEMRRRQLLLLHLRPRPLF